MADIVVAADAGGVVTLDSTSSLPGINNEDIDRGEVMRFDPATGKWELADATTADNAGNQRFIASQTNLEGAAHTGYRRVLFDLGREALDAADYGDPVYLSDTPGKLSLDPLDSTEEIIVGYVQPAWGNGPANAADKILWFEG
jgi:hypothetical protein